MQASWIGRSIGSKVIFKVRHKSTSGYKQFLTRVTDKEDRVSLLSHYC